MRRLRYVPLSAGFRSKYAYDNILYPVGGAVIEQASGKPWAQFIHERIFQKPGMTHSYTSVTEVPAGEDIAEPHAPVDGVLRAIPPMKIDSSAPAGAIQSPVEDMLKWVDMQLHQGEYPGGRLFSAAQSREMWTPHIAIPISDPPRRSRRPSRISRRTRSGG